MVANLGGSTPATASDGAFAQTLAAQGNSQEALAAGTGSFPPSPAPSTAGATSSATTAAATAALDSLAAVSAAGLDADDGPDLMAIPGHTPLDDHLAACGADAVLSELGLGAAFDRLPSFGAADIADLHACAAQAARATATLVQALAEGRTAA